MAQEISTAAKPVKAHHQLFKALHPTPALLKSEVGKVEGVNAKIAVLVTKLIGTMWCAYIFCLIALLSLPAILIQAGVLTNSSVPNFLTKPGLILIIAWIAQTFIQLVLLSVIMVGQNVQSLASDARAENTFKDTETILDALDIKTDGGLKDILEAVEKLKKKS